MRRAFLMLSIVTFALGTSACQFFTPFWVENLSDGPLKITYELKPSGMLPDEGVRFPRFRNFSDGRNNDWQQIRADKCVVDYEKGTVSAVIEPNEVLEIESEEMRAVEEEPSEHFDIKKLVLSGRSGSITFEGDHIYRQFEREDGSWFSPGGIVFVFRYR